MWVSTFHSTCVRILRKEIDQFGYKSAFSIYDAADSKRLMTLVAARPRARPQALPAARGPQLGLQPEERAARPRGRREERRTKFEETYAEAYALYQRRLREANALDFDDLIMTTVHLFQAFPEVARTTAGGSGTCSSTSTRTPTTRSTP